MGDAPLRPPPRVRARLRQSGSLALLLVLAACATAPAPPPPPDTGLSSAEEIRLGERQFGFARQSQGGDWVFDPALSAYVAGVGARLAAQAERADLPYAFAVIDSPTPAAWALPGGKVGITRGLLARLDSEAELAAVLAHQMAHAEVRRNARQLERDVLDTLGGVGITVVSDGLGHGMPEDLIVGSGRLGAVLTQIRYDAAQEADADRVGMTAMSRAGYDPAAAVALLERLAPLAGAEDDPDGWQRGLLATHAVTPERLAAARATLASLPPGGETGADAYRAAVAPLLAAAPAYLLLAEGEQALADGDSDKAALKAEAGFAVAPHLANLQTLLGAARLAQGRPADAREALDAAIEADPGEYRSRLLRGQARAALGDAAGAREDLEASLALVPTAAAHLALGRLELDDKPDSGRYHLRQAAAGGGEAGHEAAEILTRNEIGQVPGRYVAVGAGLRSDGTLFLVVHNRSPLEIANVRVEVRYADPPGSEPRTQSFTLEGPFPAAARSTQDMGFGPLSQASATTLRTQVTGAEIAAPAAP